MGSVRRRERPPCSTTDVTGDDWEVALVAKANGEKMNEDERKEVAVGHVSDLLTFAMQSGNMSMIDGIANVQTMVKEHSVRLAAADKQKCITDLFMK